MNDYKPPDADVAEFVHSMNEECRIQQQRIDALDCDAAYVIATDQNESVAARINAVRMLFCERDSRRSDVILGLFDDHDPEVWKATTCFTTDDPRVLKRLWERVESDDLDLASEALMALAGQADPKVLATAQEWMNRTREHRFAVFEAVKIMAIRQQRMGQDAHAARELLMEFWQSASLAEDERRTLALDLLGFEVPEAFEMVREMAVQTNDDWCVAAATQLHLVGDESALPAMLQILEAGSNKTRQSLILQISSLFEKLPHAWNADGLAEAKQWVLNQLEQKEEQRASGLG